MYSVTGSPKSIWRSMLFVPANVDRFFDKASRSGADAIILDLEDAVLPSEKEAARSGVRQAAASVGSHGSDVVVRINRPLRLAVRDIEVAVCPAVQALALPKVESAEEVQMLASTIGEVEAEQGMERGVTRLFVLVETPTGFLRLGDIAAAHERITALSLGTGDFSLATGIDPAADGLVYPNTQLVIAARAAGRLPLGLVSTIDDFSNLDAFRTVALRSRQIGLQGAPCVHPRQVPVLNRVFRPTEQEIAQARRLIAAFEEASPTGKGAIQVDGKMVDSPIVDGARSLLALHAAIQERDTGCQNEGYSLPH